MSSPFTVKPSTGGDIPDAIEAGNYPAILVALVDLGTQENDYNGVTSYRHEVYMAWEIHTEDKVVVLGKQFALSLTPKSNLGKFIGALSQSGKVPEGEFDLQVLLGKPCLMQVSATSKKMDQGDRTFNAPESVSRVPKGMQTPKAKQKPVAITMDMAIPDWLPRSYGTTLVDLRNQSAEKNSRTAEKAEVWRKHGRQQQKASKTGGTQQGESLADAPQTEDEIPF